MKIEWRDIPGYEGLYKVSSHGQVKSYVLGTPRVMKLHVRKRDGYLCVGLVNGQGRRTMKVHRLVAMAFLPNPDDLPDVDHIDGNRSDNSTRNLRWATKRLNNLNRHNSFGAIGIVGVTHSSSKKNPYRAHIRINGVKKMLGCYSTIAEAATARMNAYLSESQDD